MRNPTNNYSNKKHQNKDIPKLTLPIFLTRGNVVGDNLKITSTNKKRSVTFFDATSRVQVLRICLFPWPLPGRFSDFCLGLFALVQAIITPQSKFFIYGGDLASNAVGAPSFDE